ncbi:MAG: hypothetical protein GXX85_05265 [Ignavibacteria bacterium]|nr:hypothetical protein [Ignavibacteria bacterium]
MQTKCICGRELEHGKSLCYICETLALLKPEDCDKYIEIKRRCDGVKNINDIKDKRQNHNQSK